MDDRHCDISSMTARLSWAIALQRACSTIIPLILLTLSAAGSAEAQSDAEMARFVKQYRDAGFRTLRTRLLPAFEKVMSNEERIILETIEFDFPPDRNFLRAFATRSAGRRTVEISTGFLATTHFMAEALVIAFQLQQQNESISDRFNKYVEEITDITVKNTQRQRRGDSLISYKNFGEFLGWSRQRMDMFRSDPSNSNLVVEVVVEGLAFVVAHEIGHHVKGHVDKDRPATAFESRRRERDADQYAIRLTLKAGFQPMMAMSSLFMFVALEDYRTTPRDEATHPNPGCRLMDTFEASMDDLEQDAEYRKYVERHYQSGQLKRFKDQITEVRRQLNC